jgi:hypothetical protein
MAKKELGLIAQNRHQVLNRVVSDSKMSQTVIARDVLKTPSPSLLNQHLSGTKVIGDKWALRYERAFKLPVGWFDFLVTDSKPVALSASPQQETVVANALPKPEDITAVANRCEQTYHVITALHGLCVKCIGAALGDDDALPFVILSESLRSIARDMEKCAETLEVNPGGLGYFAAYYGSV